MWRLIISSRVTNWRRNWKKRSLSLVGTIRGNRKEVPKEMLPGSSKEVFSSLFGFSKDGATMVSYVPKHTKAVVLLSTQHRDNAVSTDEKSKREIIHYYNQTKSGVDVLDKLVRTYSCKRATRRWTVSLFYNLIDMAAYTALVVWISANPEWHKGKSYGRRVFLQQLGMELVCPGTYPGFFFRVSIWNQKWNLDESARLTGVQATRFDTCDAMPQPNNQYFIVALCYFGCILLHTDIFMQHSSFYFINKFQ